jgi:hypothetical protein
VALLCLSVQFSEQMMARWHNIKILTIDRIIINRVMILDFGRVENIEILVRDIG